MISLQRTTTRQTILLAVIGAGVLAAAATALMPSASDIAAATHRAKVALGGTPAPAAAPAVAEPARTLEVLASLFAQGQKLTTTELQQLLAYSAKAGSADTLSAIAKRIEANEPVPTAQITWDILASGRPAVARAFFEARPDRNLPENWQLRLELHRQTGDLAFAQSMVRTAAVTPGTTQPQVLSEAAYAVGLPDVLITAAEHGTVPRLDRARSLDLARLTVANGRPELVARIDRAGTPAWRDDDPWLAMTLAQRAGDRAAALRYAALLPTGREEARRSIIMSSGDRQAIRTMLLEQAQSDINGRPAIAQQLLESGFRPDAIALLRTVCADRLPSDALATRLLFLMGPRPDADSIAWLRARASANPAWRKAYTEREKPATALAFLETRPDADSTAMLLQRLRLANDARDKAAATRALTKLLDGRPHSAAEAAAMTAAAPARLDKSLALTLTRARIKAGAALPNDQLDLAWEAWNRGNAGEAQEHLKVHLAAAPRDLSALRLMAALEKARSGEKASRVWLERALAVTPPVSVERAEILEQLGRTGEALTLVQTLRQTSPGNRHLEAMNGRLLIAAGDPGRARKVLRP